MPAPLSHDIGTQPAAGIRAWFVVLNPRSGRHEAGALRARLAELLGREGRTVEFIDIVGGNVVSACTQAARRAAGAGGAMVVAGGDGTVNAAAQAAVTHACPMAVVAQGTFNCFAREHALPLDGAAAASGLLDAHVQPVQVALLNQRVFLVNASIGLYPQLLEDREVFKQKLGRRRWVAMLAGLKSVFAWRRHLDIEVELDGEIRRLRTPSVFVGNNRMQLEQAGVAEELTRQVGTGRLIAMVARPQGRWAKLRWLARLLVGKLGASPEIDTYAVRSITVAASRHRLLKTATDGEALAMMPPLRFAVSPKPLLLLKPATQATTTEKTE